MQFITTGNRIAVENFEIGYFYTITMLSGNYFQACCTGIGSDFVMFSRDEPDLLFSLTMQSAADVISIELYGGGSGTNDYNDLINKPQINSITLIGNKSLSDLGIQETISDLDTIRSGAAAGATAVQPAAMSAALAAKQDTISDLDTIRSGAAAGATAVQPAAMATALAAKQDTISDLDTIRSGAAAGATAVQPAAMATALAAKQDTISDLNTIRSGAAAGSTAVQPAAMATALAAKQDTLSSAQLAAVNSGIDSTKVAQIETNKNNISLNTAEITGQQNATTDTVAGRGYAIINGQRLYMGAAQMPERTGDIWLDGATVRESEYLLTSNPLCGIGTYKDSLNLATGACTRQIKKFVLTGEESWAEGSATYYIRLPSNGRPYSNALCTHAKNASSIDNNGNYLYMQKSIFIFETLTDFKSYLAAQYAAETPVTVWYVLATPETETITIPSGNFGTVEGYLIQDGTPTPTDPIYPTANEVPVWG